MLEDSFPDMSTIMKQQDHPSFQARQRWERRAMVKFSRTIRHHMRDPKLFTPEKCWTSEESRLTDTLLARLREQPGDTLEEGLAQLCKTAASQGDDADTRAVLTRLQQFPHIFDLADARHDLEQYDLSGLPRARTTPTLTQVRYLGWNIPMRSLTSFTTMGTLDPATFELLANLLRPHLPRTTRLHNAFTLRTGKWKKEALKDTAKTSA